MKAETKILLGVLLVTVILITGGIFFLSKRVPHTQQTEQGLVYQIDYSKGHKTGSDSARLKLVEFSDFQCPACRAAEPELEKIRGTLVENGQVQFIYRHFPLYPRPHLFAKMAAEAGEEASTEGKFWQYHDKLFETQKEWSSLADPTDYLANLGEQAGVDPAKIKQAIQSNTYDSTIQDDITEGNKLGVNSTPTFFLNGRKVVLTQYTSLEEIVQNALKSQ